jgi:SAM-dependent methyltransferase
MITEPPRGVTVCDVRSALVCFLLTGAGEAVVTEPNADVRSGPAAYDADYRDPAGPPWEIGQPQPALAALLDTEVRGPKVLDAGCGTGDLAIALARRGFDVTAVDFSPVAIDLARAKASKSRVTIAFDVQDATALSLPAAPFDSIFDSGLLHNLHREDPAKAAAFLARLPALAAPGAAVFVLAVSAEAGQGWGLTADRLRAEFAEPDWVDTRVEPTEVTAQMLSLPALLLRTHRAG